MVAPTEHLKKQWAEAAARVGHQARPRFSTRRAAQQGVPRRRRDLRAGRRAARAAPQPLPSSARRSSSSTRSTTPVTPSPGARPASRPSSRPTRRLALTGTPFRSDTTPHPLRHYERGTTASGGRRRLHLRLRQRARRRRRAARHLPLLQRQHALAHQGRRRDRRAARRADDQGRHLARPGAPRSTRAASGSRPCCAPPTSGSPRSGRASPTPAGSSSPPTRTPRAPTPSSSARSPAQGRRSSSPTTPARSSGSTSSRQQRRWMVAVRMVSEGVDVPRLAVGVYATTISTPLFFAQAVGRFVRSRRRGETASVFLPTVPTCSASPTRWRSSATTPSTSRGGGRRRRSDDEPAEAANREEDEPPRSTSCPFEALESDAVFDRVLYDGAEFGMQAHPGSEEEQDYLGIPGLLEPDQVQLLLQKRQARQIAHSRRSTQAHRRGRHARTCRALPHAQGAAVAAQQPRGAVGAAHRRGALASACRTAPRVRRPRRRAGDRDPTAGAHRTAPAAPRQSLIGPSRPRGRQRFGSVFYSV